MGDQSPREKVGWGFSGRRRVRWMKRIELDGRMVWNGKRRGPGGCAAVWWVSEQWVRRGERNAETRGNPGAAQTQANLTVPRCR